jgi:hypothetical protein
MTGHLKPPIVPASLSGMPRILDAAAKLPPSTAVAHYIFVSTALAITVFRFVQNVRCVHTHRLTNCRDMLEDASLEGGLPLSC